jgi:hypothetical protein
MISKDMDHLGSCSSPIYESSVWQIDDLLESDRYIGDKSIYWRLTICKMTRYRRVISKKGEESV